MVEEEWGWFRNGPGKWTKRKYRVGEEVPDDEEYEKQFVDRGLWCGGDGGARNLTENERDALFIQTGKDFGPGATLRDVEVYGQESGTPFRIGEQDDTKRIESTTEYPAKINKDEAGRDIKRAKKLLTSRSGYAKHAQSGGIHAEQARREGRG